MKKYFLELNHKANKDGKYSLFLRISENRKMVRRAIGYSIESKYFNKKNHSIRAGCPDASAIIEKYKTLKSELERYELEANKRKQIISIHALKLLRSPLIVERFLSNSIQSVLLYPL